MGRCIETANIVCEILQEDYETDNRLIECNHGDCEGMRLDDIEKQMSDFYTLRKNNKWVVRWPNGESYADVYKRAKKFFETLKLDNNILIISHEMFNKTLLGYVLGWDKEKIMRRKQVNTNIFCIDINNRKLQILDF